MDPTSPGGWPWASEPAAGASAAWGGVLLGAAPGDHRPLQGPEGDFQAGTGPDAVLQDGDIETAHGLSAEKAALSTVGFYTNKKKNKYHI